MNDIEKIDTQIQHKPVLLHEVLYFLAPQPGKVYVDVTLGGGGHTRAILMQEPTCKVIGMDWDESVINSTGKRLQEEFPGRFTPVWANFSKINAALAKIGVHKVDGILADFGTSQIQIASTPGLSIFQDKFLDMRMSSSFFKVTACDVVNNFPEKELAQIFFDFGQERYGNKIAKAIVQARQKALIKTTGQLAKLIESVVPRGKEGKIHPATKVFQALRIFVNKELENIQSFLANSFKVLAPNSRLVCISFHSLEDRLVKQFFREHAKNSVVHIEILTPKVCTATEEELKINRSARSAKLRAIKFDISVDKNSF
ncbi:16S rRNA (cytosine(1402)-N(4))-methyltransferase RsmH [Candidatus Babeliales bacterium]|nr:16S rRNA (cytosine(1402)-N(4))-methyltransferase RsmH [Candidatus Babeliales bacterium]MBP9843885.1 16S rRNA (cytosine(1402)-N(4))-methyltransferase RsmH [Candidatus Babeliales bacterium]